MKKLKEKIKELNNDDMEHLHHWLGGIWSHRKSGLDKETLSKKMSCVKRGGSWKNGKCTEKLGVNFHTNVSK